jgi:hypothetical protein
VYQFTHFHDFAKIHTVSVIVNDEDGPRAVETGFGTFDAKPYLLSEEFSDVKIKAGSEVIPAHKIILSG